MAKAPPRSQCWVTALAYVMLMACSADPSSPVDAGGADAGLPDRAALEAADRFWDAFAICGEAVDVARTISEAARAADRVVLARVHAVTLGNTIDNGSDDFYAEANLTVTVDETLRDSDEKTLKHSLILRDSRRERLEDVLRDLQSNLPTQQLLLIVRKRRDLPAEPDLYRLYGGDRGLWTQTTRAQLDNPIAHTSCGGHFGEDVVSSFFEGYDTLPEVVAFLRRD